MADRRLILPFVLGLHGCASARPVPPVDLTAARAAVEKAREAGAPDRAKEPFSRAVSHLQEAEALAAAKDRDAVNKAVCLGQTATAEAEWAAAQAKVVAGSAGPNPSQEIDRLATRLKKSEDEQRRLEDRLVLVQRDLDLTETEVIRTKARLKGIETKAEASSAIAEARILVGRLAEKGRTALLARCQESLSKAEQLLRDENFGAAIFFAQKAQDTATKGEDAPGAESPKEDRPAPQKRVVVTGVDVNIRAGPSLQAAVIGKAPRGASLQAEAIRGDWVRVRYGDLTGWVHSSYVQPGGGSP